MPVAFSGFHLNSGQDRHAAAVWPVGPRRYGESGAGQTCAGMRQGVPVWMPGAGGPRSASSAAATNAFELGRKQLVIFLRYRVDIGVVAVAVARGELRPATGESMAKSMSAAMDLRRSREGRHDYDRCKSYDCLPPHYCSLQNKSLVSRAPEYAGRELRPSVGAMTGWFVAAPSKKQKAAQRRPHSN
jgi:hypothetical protein